MVCFSTHQYTIPGANGAAWADRLLYFYGPDVSVGYVLMPDMEIHSGVNMSQVAELLRTPARTLAAGNIVVHLGRKWIGLTQASILPAIPKAWQEDKKQNNAADELFKNDAEFKALVESCKDTWVSITGCYKNGYERMIQSNFKKQLSEEQLLHLFRLLMTTVTHDGKAFYDPVKKRFHVLAHTRIIWLDTDCLQMGLDIDFDLDDGFAPDVFHEENANEEDSIPTNRWNQTHLKNWINQNRPPQPILPWLL
jgi:hypothetical protein